ncbi:MAG: SCO family protein [Polyangiaceae bacterium]|nr:SCO family protein [Polyangiaceae bacterium]
MRRAEAPRAEVRRAEAPRAGLLTASLLSSALLLSSAVALTACDNTPKAAAKDLRVDAGAEQLPELGDIGQFELTSHAGAKVTRQTLEGKVWVANFFFTRCPVVCPRLIRKAREVQVQGKQRGLSFQLVSFSVDPDNDTPAELTAYAKKHEADLSSWTFLTGDYEVVKRTSVEGFKLALEGSADASADHFGILHGSHLVLVDTRGKIRGFYRPEEERSMEQLLTDIGRLSK